MTRGSNQRNKRGFTMAEVLMVIAILAVLAAVAIPAVAQIQKKMDIAQLDETARQIFLAAQNEVTTLKASGRLEDFAGTLKDCEISTKPADYPADDQAWQGLCTVSGSNEAAAAYLLRTGSALTDATQGGEFLLELNPNTGDVYGAFYAKTPIDYAAVQKTCQENRDRATRQPAFLGYYGGSVGDSGAVGIPQTFEPKITMVNGEELYLTVTCDGLRALRPTQRDLSLAVTVADAHQKSWSKTWQGGTELFIGGTGGERITAQLVLDSLDSALAFSTVTEGKLTPGDKLTITATVHYANAGVNISGTATAITNSLFGDGTTEGNLQISKLRHLNNLRNYPATHGVTITQTAPIDFDFAQWEKSEYCSPWTKSPLKTFAPIENGPLLAGMTYDGQNNPITGLPIRGKDDVGLFSKLSDSTLRNIRLVDCSVSATGSRVGTLAGTVSGVATSMQIENCGVYLRTLDQANRFFKDMEAHINKYAVTGLADVGGLIGRADQQVAVQNSFAALNVTGTSNVGGLIGTYKKGTVQSCYASGTVTAAAGHAGGLVGHAQGGIISDCYATSNVKGTGNVGGLVGNSGNPALRDCKAYGLVDSKTATASGGVVGSGNAACTNCAYLVQSEYNSDLSKAYVGAAPKGYAELKTDPKYPNPPENSHPYQKNLLKKAFPFPLLKTGAIMPHYGSWPPELRLQAMLVYYERYADQGYGYHAVNPAKNPADSLTLDTLKNQPCVEDGYALLTTADLTSLTYTLNGEAGEDPIPVQKPDVAEPEADSATLLARNVSLKFTNGTPAVAGANVYRLPYDLQMRDEYEQFYDALTITAAGETTAFYYCPNFAKNAVNPAMIAGKPVAPTSPETALIRSARQLNSLGGKGEPQNFGTLSFLQETEIDFARYVTTYCGEPYDLKLTNNLPIGTAKTPFQTTYDGANHPISNLNVPLFANSSGTLKNIRLAQVTLSDKGNLAALSLENSGSIDRCSALGTVTATNRGAAGLVYSNLGTVTNSSFTGNVTASNGDAAGLVGENSGSIQSCYVHGTVAANQTASGFLGATTANGSMVEKSYANCSVISKHGNGAAFVGSQKHGSIQNCYAAGSVQAPKGIAYGLRGEGTATLANSYTVAALTGKQWCPLAAAGNKELSNCYWATDVVHVGGRTSAPANRGKTLSNLRNLPLDTLSAAFERATVDTSHPDAFPLRGKAYPYPKLVGLDHYGDWPVGKSGGKIGAFRLYENRTLEGVSLDIDKSQETPYKGSGAKSYHFGILYDQTALENAADWTIKYTLKKDSITQEVPLPRFTPDTSDAQVTVNTGLIAYTFRPIVDGTDLTITFRNTVEKESYVFKYTYQTETFTYIP